MSKRKSIYPYEQWKEKQLREIENCYMNTNRARKMTYFSILYTCTCEKKVRKEKNINQWMSRYLYEQWKEKQLGKVEDCYENVNEAREDAFLYTMDMCMLVKSDREGEKYE